MGKICTVCGEEFSDRETKTCSICAKKRNRQQSIKLANKKANGICIQCGKKSEGGVKCRSCADKINLKRREERAKRRKLLQNNYIKEEYIKVIFKPVGKPPELLKIQNDIMIFKTILCAYGHLEEIDLPTGEGLLLNDEGLINNSALNFETGYYKIRADAFIVGKDGFYFTSLSEESIEKWLNFFVKAGI